MQEILIQNAQTFGSQQQLQLAERLGFGIHGIIFVAEDKSKAGKTALKVHRSVEPYLREREVYERLRDAGVSEVLGFNVPQLIRFDDELRIIEMSIVALPDVGGTLISHHFNEWRVTGNSTSPTSVTPPVSGCASADRWTRRWAPIRRQNGLAESDLESLRRDDSV